MTFQSIFAKTSDEVANVKLLPNQDGSSLGFEGVELKMLKYSVRQHRKLICSRNQLDPVADQFSAESKLPVSDRTLFTWEPFVMFFGPVTLTGRRRSSTHNASCVGTNRTPRNLAKQSVITGAPGRHAIVSRCWWPAAETGSREASSARQPLVYTTLTHN